MNVNAGIWAMSCEETSPQMSAIIYIKKWCFIHLVKRRAASKNGILEMISAERPKQ